MCGIILEEWELIGKTHIQGSFEFSDVRNKKRLKLGYSGRPGMLDL